MCRRNHIFRDGHDLFRVGKAKEYDEDGYFPDESSRSIIPSGFSMAEKPFSLTQIPDRIMSQVIAINFLPVSVMVLTDSTADLWIKTRHPVWPSSSCLHLLSQDTRARGINGVGKTNQAGSLIIEWSVKADGHLTVFLPVFQFEIKMSLPDVSTLTTLNLS
jgi:hypothetical protein